MTIRKAQPADLPALLAIYNHEVTHGTATFDIHEKTLAERQAWMAAHAQAPYTLLVAETDGRVAGYASLSPYREKEAFQTTVELSVYVDSACRGQGVATALMEAILAAARADDCIHTVISVITGGNAVSIHLHEKCGFTACGVIRQAGKKFDRWLDILHYQLMV